ncbi:MAG TPA: hypothetical protein DCZ75_09975, partial [Geobacter sp.]|nr:hypothetical protein [Geobacter sp.]
VLMIVLMIVVMVGGAAAAIYTHVNNLLLLLINGVSRQRAYSITESDVKNSGRDSEVSLWH